MGTDNVEWIIVFDGEIDERILMYEKNVKVILKGLKRKKGNSYASSLRNEGLKHISGDYIYYLDDDNLISNKLYEALIKYRENDKILLVNQYSIRLNRRITKFDINNISSGYIDTAQMIVPAKYKNIKWINKNEIIDEYPYLLKLIDEAGSDNIKFINKIYSYRNALRRLELR